MGKGNFHFQQAKDHLCRVNDVNLPCLADVFFGFGTTSGRCPFFKRIGEARVKSVNLLFWWSV